MTLKRLAILAAVTLGIGCSAAFAATLGVGSWHVWAGSQTLTKGTCTLSGTTSTTDTYVDEHLPTSSFGGSTTLTVGPKTNLRTWAFIRFDLSSCNIPSTGGADSATLSLRVITAPNSSQSIDVAPVTATWGDTTTWNGAQSLTFGSNFATITTGTTNNVTKTVTVTADVDSLIRNGSANFGWRLSEAGTNANVTTIFGSAANATAANQPQLTINYEK
jgi:hypothetical protein